MTVYILWESCASLERSIVEIHSTRESAEETMKYTACKCGHSRAYHRDLAQDCFDCECRAFVSVAGLEIEEREVKS